MLTKTAEPVKPIFTEVKEQCRTYIYADGTKYRIPGMVTSINVSKSGTHRLNTDNGFMYIIVSGWIAIEFNATEWTF